MLRRYRVAGLVGVLLFANGVLMLLAPASRFQAIVIHHTATTSGSYESVRRYHVDQRGWRDAAYHLLLSNGTQGIPLGHLESGERYRGLSGANATRSDEYNRTAIHLCIVGNYDIGPLPRELRAPLANAVARLQRVYGIPDDRILFHADCSPSACPGRYLTKEDLLAWVKHEASDCPPEVRRQQGAVISRAGFTPAGGARVLRAMAWMSLFISLAWWMTFAIGMRGEMRPTRRRPRRVRVVIVTAAQTMPVRPVQAEAALLRRPAGPRSMSPPREQPARE